MEEWKQSFRDIYGRSPTAGDLSIAPSHLKEELRCEKDTSDEKPTRKGLKRKNFEMKMMEDEQFSPIKKRANLKKLGEKTDLKTFSPLRTSPRKKMMSLDDSPVKAINENSTSFSSPGKKQILPANFDLNDFSPLKSMGTTSCSTTKCSLTPIKSPSKKAYRRQLFNQDLQMLLLPTPEKGAECDEDEEVEQFDDETNEDVSIAKAQRPVARKLGGFTKKNDQNFQKINLRKKQFVRGKVTAEQKRKLKRKQMFKKKT